MNANTFVMLGMLMLDVFLIGGLLLTIAAMIKGGEDRP